MPRSPLQGPYEYADTYEIIGDDSASGISSDDYTRSPSGGSNEVARYALIQPLNYGIKWAIGATPVLDGLGYECAAGSSITLVGEYAIKNFQFINLSSGNNASLQVTLGF